MGIWMYLVLAVTILVAFNVLLAALLSRANAGQRLGPSDESRLKSR